MSSIKFRILKKLNLSQQDDENIKKEFRLNHFNHQPLIKIDTEKKTLAITFEYDCSVLTPKNLMKLISSSDYRKDHQDMLREYKDIIYQLRDVAYEFDLLLRDELDRVMKQSLLGETIDEFFYDQNSEEWVSSKDLPTYNAILSVSKAEKIDLNFISKIERIIADEETPFLASHFLDIASSTKDPKTKWVVGTIALEVGIKEAIIRIDEKLEVLFLEIPSPPLHKLYKSVLKSLTEVESPFYKEIQKGARVRNKIVHKPSKIFIEDQDAVDYLSMINVAINHLKHLTRCIKNEEKPRQNFYKYTDINFSKYLN
jgi:hypothetical protein